MYGAKRKDVEVYQLMKDIYTILQGEKIVSNYYHALKGKWEDLHYHMDEN